MKYTVSTQETHYATYNVYYTVEADSPEEAARQAMNYWEYSKSTASLSMWDTIDDKLTRDSFIGGELNAVTDEAGGYWDTDDLPSI